MVDNQPSDDTTLFSPVNPGRVSAEIVEQIKARIRSGTLRPGDRLPPERRLTEAFKVSRVTVRDALRSLEANGLIDVRVGSGGGAFITAPGSAHVSEGLGNALALQSISAEEITETRRVIELGLLPLIVERATEEDFEALLEICDRADASWASGAYDVRLSAEFHVRLAEACHNEAISMIVSSLHGHLVDSLLRAKAAAPEMGRLGAQEHRQVVNAIRTRQPEEAHKVMAAHLDRTAERVRNP